MKILTWIPVIGVLIDLVIDKQRGNKLYLIYVIIQAWILFLILLSSCTSMEECEEQVGNQYRYEVILLDNNGYEINRKFCNSYITLYGDSMTKFSYDYCNLRKRIKRDQFELKVGTYKINQL